MRKLLLLELNEVNFDYVRHYAAQGHLPNIGALIERHGIGSTTSETDHSAIEPWVQWVTAHTGRTFSDHGVFRLGDIADRPDVTQIWETLEQAGVSVGAVSPMNARNACQHAAFFVPDPWSRERVTGSKLTKRLHAAIGQLVNDNATGRIEKSSLAWLSAGLLRFARLTNYLRYARLAARVRKPWSRALILDLLLADLFRAELKRTEAQFATLFLNGAAHIQHHYLFNSAAYRGDNHNPGWYIAGDEDPLREALELYDAIVGSIVRQFPDHRVLLATGLHQDPFGTTLFYWRLRDHAAFLDEAGIVYRRVEPRMSRDFVVYCDNSGQANEAQRKLESAVADDGQPLFAVDNRGDSLFVMLVFGSDIAKDLGYVLDGRRFTGLSEKTSFVAIKNGEHNGLGYLIDTAAGPGVHPQVPLASLHGRVLRHFGLEQRAAELAESARLAGQRTVAEAA